MIKGFYTETFYSPLQWTVESAVTNINNVPIIWLFFYLPKYNLRERAAQFIDKQQ